MLFTDVDLSPGEHLLVTGAVSQEMGRWLFPLLPPCLTHQALPQKGVFSKHKSCRSSQWVVVTKTLPVFKLLTGDGQDHIELVLEEKWETKRRKVTLWFSYPAAACLQTNGLLDPSSVFLNKNCCGEVKSYVCK